MLAGRLQHTAAVQHLTCRHGPSVHVLNHRVGQDPPDLSVPPLRIADLRLESAADPVHSARTHTFSVNKKDLRNCRCELRQPRPGALPLPPEPLLGREQPRLQLPEPRLPIRFRPSNLCPCVGECTLEQGELGLRREEPTLGGRGARREGGDGDRGGRVLKLELGGEVKFWMMGKNGKRTEASSERRALRSSPSDWTAFCFIASSRISSSIVCRSPPCQSN